MFIDNFLNSLNTKNDNALFSFLNSLATKCYIDYYFNILFKLNYEINFNDESFYDKLLQNEISFKTYLIILKGITNENIKLKYTLVFIEKFSFNDDFLYEIYKTFNNDANKICLLRCFKSKEYYSHALILLNNKSFIKEKIDHLTKEDFLLFVRYLDDNEKIYYINKGVMVTDIISMLSLENIDIYLNKLSRFQKRIAILKINDPDIKKLMLEKYCSLFSYEEINYYLNQDNKR